jgi:hypothetical protein
VSFVNEPLLLRRSRIFIFAAQPQIFIFILDAETLPSGGLGRAVRG